MQPENLFDNIADRYDSLFTRSATGKAQREIVWNYLRNRISPGMDVLEINCGTGEDALFLSKLGCNVLATDASATMIDQCLNKIQNDPHYPVPEFHRASFSELVPLVREHKFDLVFSDFSGLNCLEAEALKITAGQLHLLLKPDSRMILVVFSKHCLWEKAYMLLKRRFRDINRRKKTAVVNIPGSAICVFYYSAKELKQIFRGYFRFTAKKPVGLFIPPSYLDSCFKNKKLLFVVLVFLEKIFGRFSFLSEFADHYLIEFRKI